MRHYKITKVVFDTDGDHQQNKRLVDEYVGKVIDVDDDDLDEEEAQDAAMDQVSDDSGWCILGIKFEKVEG